MYINLIGPKGCVCLVKIRLCFVNILSIWRELSIPVSAYFLFPQKKLLSSLSQTSPPLVSNTGSIMMETHLEVAVFFFSKRKESALYPKQVEFMSNTHSVHPPTMRSS